MCTMMGPLSEHKLVGEGNFLWEKKEVSVWFMDDDGEIKDQVLKIANEWKQFSGVRFILGFTPQSDIRVSFRTKGWWSYIGSNSSKLRSDSVSLSLDSIYLYDRAKMRSVVLHEFGHSLGLLHEHQHPEAKINWNLPVLFNYYKKTFNVDSTWVTDNVLETYNSGTGIYCEFDRRSIMIYEIPDSVTIDHFKVDGTLVLSELDKKYINLMYAHKSCK